MPAIPENKFLSRAAPKEKTDSSKDDSKKHSKKGRSRSRSRSRSRGRDRDRRDRDRRQNSRNRAEGRNEGPRYGRSGRNSNDGKKVKGRGRIVSKFTKKKRRSNFTI